MREFFKEFKDFIATGNMIELAVAVILAGAVGAVITAFTEGIMMQIVAAIFGTPDFSSWTWTIRKNTGKDPVTGDPTDSVLRLGTFVNTLITLVLTGLVLFLIIKAYNKMKKARPEDVLPTEAELLIEIRDELRAQRGGVTGA